MSPVENKTLTMMEVNPGTGVLKRNFFKLLELSKRADL